MNGMMSGGEMLFRPNLCRVIYSVEFEKVKTDTYDASNSTRGTSHFSTCDVLVHVNPHPSRCTSSLLFQPLSFLVSCIQSSSKDIMLKKLTAIRSHAGSSHTHEHRYCHSDFHLLPSHGNLNCSQSGHDLFIVVTPTNNGQTDWRSKVFLGREEFIVVLVVAVHGHISLFFQVHFLIDKCYGENGCWVVQEVPLPCVAPVAGRIMKRSSTGCSGADDYVDLLLTPLRSFTPVSSISFTVRVAFQAKLPLLSQLHITASRYVPSSIRAW